MRVAIFDFDGTLYKKETFKILMDFLKNHPVYHSKYKQFIRRILPRYIAYKMKLYPEAKMKERSMQKYISVLSDLSKDELESYFHGAAKGMEKDFNQAVVSKLEQHIANEDYVMLVSGAYTIFIDGAISRLPFKFDTVIGTEIPFKEQKFNNNNPIYHINGQRKNDAIHEALAGKKIDWENSFAYADSYSDLTVLELVGNPVAVQPDMKLKQIAEQHQWEII